MPSAGFLEADRRHDLGALLRQTICRRPGIAVAIRHFHQLPKIALYAAFDQVVGMEGHF